MPKDGTDVVNLQVHPFEPVRKPITSLGEGLLASRPVIVRASLANDDLLNRLAELERGVFPHRLVQAIAGDTSQLVFHHE